MSTWLSALCAAIILAGCVSVDSVKDAKGQGVKRTFRQPYDAVYEAVLNAAAKRKLELVEQDKAAGRVVLSGPASWTSLGERIAVFVTRGSDKATTVEVVSKPVGGALTFPPDWPALLFGDIEQELTPKRPR
jgi:hypothetical protein